MNLFAIGGLVLSITCILLALIVLINIKNTLQRTWLFFNLAVALWGIGAFFVGQAKSFTTAILFWKIAHVGVIFIAVYFLHTVIILCEQEKKLKNILIFAYLQGVAFLFLLLTNQFISKVKLIYGSIYYNYSSGVLYPLFFFIWITLVVLGHFELIKCYIKSQGAKRNQIKYFFLGILIGFSGGVTNFFPMFGINIYPLGNFTIPLYCIISTYAILRYNLLDIRVAITRAGLFLIVYSLTLGVPFWYGFRTEEWLLVSIATAVLATAGPFIYIVLKEKAENILLAQQKRYQNILLQASNGMVRQHDLGKLVKLTAYIIKKSVNISFAAVFLYNKDNNKYELKVIRASEPSDITTNFNTDHPFIQYMITVEDPFTYEEIPQNIKDSLNMEFGALIVPSFVEKRFIGFLVLGKKLNKAIYSQEDINVFKTLSNQAALAVENCLILIEAKKTQQKLFSAEKLASIGGMADGVAHQIKNRLNLFSCAAGEQMFEIEDFIKDNAKLLDDNPKLKLSFDYIWKAAEQITDNVKKTDGIIQGILNFARTEYKEHYYANFSLRELVESSTLLLCAKHQLDTLPVTMNIADDTIYGVKAQLLECVLNLLDNSYEAIKEKVEYHLTDADKNTFTPSITVSAATKDGRSHIIFKDNGIGIKEEDKLRIFAPFFTTKSSTISGSGIGMYVVKRMVDENHNGKIWFESEYMKGTTIFIDMPFKTVSSATGHAAHVY